jgi:hypothetical protein
VIVEPEDVLELMRSAAERYESVRAALRYRGDGPTIKAVRERFLRSDGPFGWRCRIWRVDNHRWRQELGLPDGGATRGTISENSSTRHLGE